MDGSTGNDIQYSSSLTIVSATWNEFTDEESGIYKYIISVYRKTLDSLNSQLIHTEIVSDTSYTGNHFSFSNGDFIHVVVESFNGAGLSTSVASNGYIIDLTSPQVTKLQDGSIGSSDLGYLSSSDTYTANWLAYDDESNINKTEIAIFHVYEGKKIRIYPDPESEVVTKILEAGSTTDTITDLDMIHNHKYIAALTFTNEAGLSSTFETDGVIVDLIIPTVGMVTVFGDTYLTSEEEEVMMLGNTEQVEATWSGSDSGSGVLEYLVAVVTDDDDIVNPDGEYVNFGLLTNGRITGLNLTVGNENDGPFYKVKVIVKDKSGQISNAGYSEDFW